MSGTPSTVNLSDNRGPYIHAAVGTCLALAVIGVVARLVCRRIMKTALNASDYFVIAGLVAAIVEGSLIFAGINVGFGKHVELLSAPQLEQFLKIFFAAEIFYVLTITLTKISILLLYRSLFPDKQIATAIYIIGAAVLAWALACIFGVIFSCVPVHGFWSVDPTLKKKCIDSTKFFIGNAIPNMVTDTCILLLPLRRLWQLQLSTQKKIMCSGMFLLGSFVIVASILRLALLFDEDLSDPTFGLVNAFTWSNIEVDMAVLSACLPTLRPLVIKLFPSAFLTTIKPTHDRSISKDAYAKLSRNKNQSGDEFITLPHAGVTNDASIYGPEEGEHSGGGEGYMMKGITVRKEFSATSRETDR